MTRSKGIGYYGHLPWKCKAELRLFRNITIGAVLIMGRKTVETLPLLKKRNIICVTRNDCVDSTQWKNEVIRASSVEDAMDIANTFWPMKPVFIAGGATIYNLALSPPFVDRVHKLFVTIMNDDFECDTHLCVNVERGWHNESVLTDNEKFTHFVKIHM